MVVIGFLKVLAWAIGTALSGLAAFALLHLMVERGRPIPSSNTKTSASPFSTMGPQASSQPAGARLSTHDGRRR